MSVAPAPSRTALINIVALGVATSVTLVVLYVLCAVVAMALPNIASHAWLTLFTTAPIGSMWGLIEGIIWSIVFGWVMRSCWGRSTTGSRATNMKRANHVCL
jgi:hypothetical protein